MLWAVVAVAAGAGGLAIAGGAADASVLAEGVLAPQVGLVDQHHADAVGPAAAFADLARRRSGHAENQRSMQRRNERQPDPEALFLCAGDRHERSVDRQRAIGRLRNFVSVHLACSASWIRNTVVVLNPLRLSL